MATPSLRKYELAGIVSVITLIASYIKDIAQVTVDGVNNTLDCYDYDMDNSNTPIRNVMEQLQADQNQNVQIIVESCSDKNLRSSTQKIIRVPSLNSDQHLLSRFTTQEYVIDTSHVLIHKLRYRDFIRYEPKQTLAFQSNATKFLRGYLLTTPSNEPIYLAFEHKTQDYCLGTQIGLFKRVSEFCVSLAQENFLSMGKIYKVTTSEFGRPFRKSCFAIEFPADLRPNLKMLLLGATMQLSVSYFERKCSGYDCVALGIPLVIFFMTLPIIVVVVILSV
ncbi:unnamed protein product [Allacma fusca]|uniref:Uncharacterized protein n=1 Tax=Allacma fusca TaxID=39272 RepID=A0A8J2PGW7_9HEXA|nr:unnamed protein product [Allacma fusca]